MTRKKRSRVLVRVLSNPCSKHASSGAKRLNVAFGVSVLCCLFALGCDPDNAPDEDCTELEGGCSTCGDGKAELSEPCDGEDLRGASCTTLGYTGGTLLCDGCTLDESGCTGATCGNGKAEVAEECDGPDYRGAACTDLGYTGGELSCTTSCIVNTSNCTGTPPECDPLTEWECNPGNCIPTTALCDETADCLGSEDEAPANCP